MITKSGYGTNRTNNVSSEKTQRYKKLLEEPQKQQVSYNPVNSNKFIKDNFLTSEEIDKRIYTLPDGTTANKQDYTPEEQQLLLSGKYKINPNYDPNKYMSQKILSTGELKSAEQFRKETYDNANALGKAQIIAGKVGNTAKDIVGSAGVGAISAAEGLANTGIAAVGNVANLVGARDVANFTTNMLKDDITGELNQRLNTSTQSGYGRYTPSILGIEARDIAQEAVRMATAGAGGTAGFIGSAIGGNIGEAIREGENLGRATAYGTVTGTIEGATEKLFDTFNLLGGGVLDKFVPKNVIAKFATGAIGEGIEEMISESLNPFAKILTYEGETTNPFSSGKDFKEYVKNIGVAGWQGFVMGMFMQGVHDVSNAEVRKQYKEEVTKAVNKVKGLTQQQKQVAIDTLVNEANTSNIQPESMEKLINNKETQQNVLPRATETQIQQPKQETATDTELKLPTTKTNSVYQAAKGNVDVKIANRLMDIAERTNARVEGFYNENPDIEGSYKDGVIRINVNSEKAADTIFAHEFTHHLESTNAWNDVRDAIINSNTLYNMLSEQGINIDEYKQQIRDTYAANGVELKTDLDVEKEIVAKFVENNLMKDEKTIVRMINENPSFMQRLKNFWDDLVVRFKGTAEEKELRRIQNIYNKAFAEAQKGTTTSTETEYSIGGIKGARRIQKNANYSDILSNYDKATQMIADNKNIDNETLIRETGWYKDTEGNLKYEFTDEDMDIKDNFKFDTTKMYSLEQILKHDIIFEAYPELKDYTVISVNLGNKDGAIFAPGKIILLNKNKLNTKSDVAATLMHEVQHAIQVVEGFPGARTTWGGKSAYFESLGEIEAADTKRRIQMTMEERARILPETAKPKPIHPAIRERNQAKQQTVRQSVNEALNGTVGKDTQYSINTDNKGRKLSQEQQEFFKDSKVRDEDGNLKVMYHGTPNATYTEFRSGTYFTDNKEYADKYQAQGASSLSYKTTANKPSTYEVYLNIKKPFDTRNPEEKEIFENEYYRKWGTGTPLMESGLPDWTDGMDLQEFIEEMGYDYDGLILDEGAIGGYGDEVQSRGLSYVAFYPNQIKNVDNTNPTSDPDIKYSINTDNMGRKLSEQQQEFFKDSKVRDDEGRLLEVYHGSKNSDFDIFKYDKNVQTGTDYGEAYYFTSDYKKAQGYAYDPEKDPRVQEYQKERQRLINKFLETKSEEDRQAALNYKLDGKSLHDLINDEDYLTEGGVVKKTYLNLKNPLVKDANGEYYYKVYDKYFEEAKENGNDGIIVKNVIDNPRGGHRATDVYIAFYPNQIKNVDNTNPTENPDIRYSIETDKQTSTPKIYLSEHANTLLEAGVTLPETRDVIAKMVEQGTLTHERITDKDAQAYAEKYIIENGFEDAVQHWNHLIKSNREMSKEELALGQMIYNNAEQARDVNLVKKMIADLVAEGTTAGRNLQAMSMVKRLTPDGRLYALERSVQKLNQQYRDEIGKKFKDIEIPNDLAEALLKSKDQKEIDANVEKIQQYIADQIPATWKDKLNAWRYLAMLGNTRTHIRNLAGNAVFIPAIEIKNAMALVGEKTLPTAERTKAILTKKDRALLDFAENDFANNEQTIRGENKFDIASGVQEKRRIFDNKVLETLRKANFAALEKEDAMFLKYHYKRAMARAIKAKGLSLEQLKSGSAEMNSKLSEIRNYAINEAQKATYRDFNALAKWISNNKSRLKRNAAQSKGYKKAGYELAYAGVEGLIPFTKTPANIVKRIVEYSPVGIAKGIIDSRTSVKNGEMSASQAIDELCSGLTGTGIVGLGILLASLGFVTGGGEDKQKEEQFESLKGNQNYALKIGNKTYTIDWAAPSAVPLFVGVEIFNSLKNSENADIIGSFVKIVDPVFEMSMLQGINSALSAYGSDNAIGKAVSNMFQSYLGQYVPSLFGAVARTVDPVRRTTYADKNKMLPTGLQTFTQKQLQKIPVASTMLPTYKDQFGRDSRTDNLLIRIFSNFLSPGYLAEVKDKPVENELTRIYDKTGETDVLPSYASKYITVDGEKINFTYEQYEKFATTRGDIAYKNLEKLFADARYKRLSDEEKVSAIRKIYTYANEVAKSKVSDYKLTKEKARIEKQGNNYYREVLK